jgi:hypothetical protein
LIDLPAEPVEAGGREGGEDLADPLLGGLGRGIDLPGLGLLDRPVRLGPAPLLLVLPLAALAWPLLAAGLGIATPPLTAAAGMLVAARLLLPRLLLPIVAVRTVFPGFPGPTLPGFPGSLGRPGLGLGAPS